MARTQRERDAEKRAAKLADIDEQLAEGRLSIRKMTPEELKRYERQSKPTATRKPRRKS
jgi:hypothetical protein